MTTIITIVVVALVFFVTVCIVTFMVWKREAEMRTDSIKAIEHNVEEMLHELTGSSSRDIRNRAKREEIHRDYNTPQHETNDRAEGHKGDTCEGSVQPVRAVQKESQNQPERVELKTDDERVTVFEPAAGQYTSFDRGGSLPERDGKRGLRWKEIQQPQQSADTSEVLEAPEAAAESSEASGSSEATDPYVVSEYAETQEVYENESPQQDIKQEAISADESQEIFEPQHVSVEEPQPIQEKDSESASAHLETNKEPEQEEGGPLSKLLKRRKKDKTNQESGISAEEAPPGQEMYESIEDLLKDYISEPYSSEDKHEESRDENNSQNRSEPETMTNYSEPVKPGYDVGKSGKKYTAAELEALIKE